MGRKRSTIIRESIEELRELERPFRGKPSAIRFRALRLIRSGHTVDDAARIIDYSAASVKRWLRAYGEGGIEGMIAVGTSRRGRHDSDMGDLKRKLFEGEFGSLDEIGRWIDRRQRTAEPIVAHGTDAMVPTPEGEGSSGGVVAGQLSRFLEMIPRTTDLPVWAAGFRAAMKMVIPEVDHITISLNLHCDLLEPETYEFNMMMTHSLTHGSNRIEAITDADRSPLDWHFGHLKRSGFAFDTYHPPHGFAYHYQGHAYLAVLGLWRNRSHAPISEETLAVVTSMRALLELIFSSFVARHQLGTPVMKPFTVAFTDLVRKQRLTVPEQCTAALLIIGQSYHEIAETLKLSINTVRSHVRAIYRKTGVSGQSELVARFFTGELAPEEPGEGAR